MMAQQAPMLLNHRAAQTQPQTHAFEFGGEKWCEEFVSHRVCNALP
jgi:hypothetical protein